MKIILQPSGTGNRKLKKHFEDTIVNRVLLSDMEPYLTDEQIQKITEVSDKKRFGVWGIKPAIGSNDTNKTKWSKFEDGDLVIFTGENYAQVAGTIITKFDNKELANKLWGKTEDGRDFQYMYIMDNIYNLYIPFKEISDNLDGKFNGRTPLGLALLSEEDSYRLASRYDLFDEKEFSFEEFLDNSGELINLENTDKVSVQKQRKEQSYLRNMLFKGKKICRCAICNEEIDVEFLVAAHIKKRCLCCHEERIDVHNIVVPMCVFGCDSLYEKGYIGVDDGKVISLKKAKTDYIKEAVEKRLNNKCDYYNGENKKYFDYHNNLYKK